MNATRPDRKESIAAIERLPRVGIDETDARHFFDWNRDVIYVVADDAIQHRQPLAEGELPRWIDHVRKARGWATLQYDDRPLAEKISEAVEA